MGDGNKDPLVAEQPSPLTPEINTLLAQSLVDFERYGQRLFAAVLELIKSERAFPMTEATRIALERLFADHAAALSLRFSGGARDVEAVRRALAAGMVPPNYASLRGPSTLSIMYRVGKAHDPVSPPKVRGQHVSVQEALRVAKAQPITAADMAALSYIQQRGAVYMRRPIAQMEQEVDRTLTEAEYAKVRGALGRGRRGGFSTSRLERELRDATSGTALTNDMRRVARTEGMFAAHEGALVTLKDHAGRLGMRDPEVFKIISPGACAQCRRIWGDMSKPRVYRLSEIEGASNFGVKQSDWVATIGPTHPACACPPLSIWNPKQYDAVKSAVDQIMEDYY